MVQNVNVKQLIQQFDQGSTPSVPGQKSAESTTSLGKVTTNPGLDQGAIKETDLKFNEIAEGAFQESFSSDDLQKHSFTPLEASPLPPSIEATLTETAAAAPQTEVSLEKQPEFVLIQAEVKQFEEIAGRLKEKINEIKQDLETPPPPTIERLDEMKDQLEALEKELSKWKRDNETLFYSKLEELSSRLDEQVAKGELSETSTLKALNEAVQYSGDKLIDIIELAAETHNLNMDIGIKKAVLLVKKLDSDPKTRVSMKLSNKSEEAESVQDRMEFLADSQVLLEKLKTSPKDVEEDKQASLEKLNQATGNRTLGGPPGSTPKKSFGGKVASGVQTWLKFETGKQSKLKQSPKAFSSSNIPVAKRFAKDIKLINYDMPGLAASFIFEKMDEKLTLAEKVRKVAERATAAAFMPLIAANYITVAAIGGPLFVTVSAIKQSAQNLKASIDLEFGATHKQAQAAKAERQNNLY